MNTLPPPASDALDERRRALRELHHQWDHSTAPPDSDDYRRLLAAIVEATDALLEAEDQLQRNELRSVAPPPDDHFRGGHRVTDPYGELETLEGWAYAEVACGERPAVAFRVPMDDGWAYLSATDAIAFGSTLIRVAGAAQVALALEPRVSLLGEGERIEDLDTPEIPPVWERKR